MKTVILISSIFYILGLKISNKIDLIKQSNPVEKIITHTIKIDSHEKAADFNEVRELTTEKDTVPNRNISKQIE
jgi:hypothetical protein